MDRARAVEHYAAFLEALGLGSTDDPELQATAARVASLMWDWTEGARPAPPITLSTFEAPPHPDWVVIKGLSFYSLCAHHMVPFFGTVDVALLPAARVLGFNALARLIARFSRKPQLQEGLASDLLTTLCEQVQPAAALIRVTARQLCMEMRDHPSPAPCVSYASTPLSPPLKDLALRLLA